MRFQERTETVRSATDDFKFVDPEALSEHDYYASEVPEWAQGRCGDDATLLLACDPRLWKWTFNVDSGDDVVEKLNSASTREKFVDDIQVIVNHDQDRDDDGQYVCLAVDNFQLRRPVHQVASRLCFTLNCLPPSGSTEDAACNDSDEIIMSATPYGNSDSNPQLIHSVRILSLSMRLYWHCASDADGRDPRKMTLIMKRRFTTHGVPLTQTAHLFFAIGTQVARVNVTDKVEALLGGKNVVWFTPTLSLGMGIWNVLVRVRDFEATIVADTMKSLLLLSAQDACACDFQFTDHVDVLDYQVEDLPAARRSKCDQFSMGMRQKVACGFRTKVLRCLLSRHASIQQACSEA